MKQRIALINGSPRKANSSQIAEHIIEKFDSKASFDVLNLGEIKLNYCDACGWCKNKKGHCVKDDELDSFFKKIKQYSAIILISPVYMGGMTAQMKTFIDRTVSLRRNDFMLKNIVGAGIAVGASRNGGQELVLQDLHAGMHVGGMIVVGDNNHFGGTGHSPFPEDDFGHKTVDDTINKVIETLNLFK
jgi:multimeric flavodoxin WrbA